MSYRVTEYLGKVDLGRFTREGTIDMQDAIRVRITEENGTTREENIPIGRFVFGKAYEGVGTVKERKAYVEKMNWLPSPNRPLGGSHPVANSSERFTASIRAAAKE